VIVCDTREQANQHVLDWLTQNNIPYITKKLDSADYGFILPNYPELKLDNTIIVEKKSSGWNEICGNFTKGRERFAREFERVPEGTTVHLVIEDATFKKLVSESYRSKLPAKSLLANLLTFNVRYDLHTWTVGKGEVPMMIYKLIYYGLREKLKQMS